MKRVGDLLVEVKEFPQGSDALPVLTLTEGRGFVRQDERFKKRIAVTDTRCYKVVRRGDVSFNPYLLWAGAVASNEIAEVGLTSPAYPTFRVRSGFDPRFVALLLGSPRMIASYDAISFGSVPRRRRASVADFLGLSVEYVPTLDEQRRIANILDRAGAAPAVRRSEAAALASFPSALHESMFEGSARGVEVPLGCLLSGLEGGKSLAAPEGSGNSYRVLKISSVTSGTFLPDESKPLPEGYKPPQGHVVSDGDLLFSRANTTDLVGAVAMARGVRPNTVLPDKLWRLALAPDAPIRAEYLWAHLRSPRQRRALSAMSSGTGGSMKNIPKAKLLKLPVWVPEESLQEQFVQRVRAAEELGSAVRLASALDDELFASLQARAFRGEL